MVAVPERRDRRVRNMRVTTVAALAAGFVLTGCASIVSKSDWPVNVTSATPGVPFTIKNEHGIAVAQGKTPTVIVLTSHGGYFSGADYTIESAGATMPLNSSLNGWYVGN